MAAGHREATVTPTGTAAPTRTATVTRTPTATTAAGGAFPATGLLDDAPPDDYYLPLYFDRPTFIVEYADCKARQEQMAP